MKRLFRGGLTPAKQKTLGWGLLALVWVPMLALIVWGRGGVLDLLQLHREVSDLRAQIETLKRENQALRGEIQRLQTEASAYEGPAREMLLRKKKGEVVLYLPPSGTGPAGLPPKASAPAAMDPSNPRPANAPSAASAAPPTSAAPTSAPPSQPRTPAGGEPEVR